MFLKGWKSAIVKVIFKSGDSTDVSNYQPISILPAVSKMVEKYVAEQLIKHLSILAQLHAVRLQG